MSLSDPLSDMLTRIRNAQMVLHNAVEIPSSKFHKNVLNVLQKEGFIKGFEVFQNKKGHDALRVEIKYHDGEPVIKEIHRISKPGRRVYSKNKKLARYYNGYGVVILSTPRGVMSDHEARRQNLGGEVLCQVF